MQNLSKIDTAKDLVTKEWVEAQDFLPSSAFTKNGIKNALGIADWALAASKPSYDDVYLKLAGGTISGALLVNSTLTTSGSIYCNANIKINAGGKLILGNDEGITSWSDLKSKIAYSFSEIGSKPTTLSGYGITDAIMLAPASEHRAPTDYTAFATFAYADNGWKATGAAIAFPHGNYKGLFNFSAYDPITSPNRYPRLYINIANSGNLGQWAEVLTDKHASIMAGRGRYSSLDVNTALNAGVYEIWGGNEQHPNSPYGYGTILTMRGSQDNLYFTSQLLVDASGHLYSRMREGYEATGNWREWRTVIDSSNIGNYALTASGGTINGELKIGQALTMIGEALFKGDIPNGGTYPRFRMLMHPNGLFFQAATFDGTSTAGKVGFTGYGGNPAEDIYFNATSIRFLGAASFSKSITLGGRTISNWDQVRMMAYALPATTGSQTLHPNAHYTFMSALTSSSNLSITLTDDTSGESITKIYYIIFQTGSTTPTFTFNRTLYWKDGKNLTALAANKRYRIVIDKDLAILETYS